MAEPHDRKPILTIEQQIEHLKQKGVAFELCSEEEAADYLRDKCNFFKLASYRKLFSKYEGGPRDGRYVDLDFAASCACSRRSTRSCATPCSA